MCTEGCEYVIALTHMRTPNDIRLAESVPEIDLILGGHDHVYEKRKVNTRDCIRDFSSERRKAIS
jgi:5'-nucleotidase